MSYTYTRSKYILEALAVRYETNWVTQVSVLPWDSIPSKQNMRNTISNMLGMLAESFEQAPPK